MIKKTLTEADICAKDYDAEKKQWGKPDKKGLYSKRLKNEQAWQVSMDDFQGGQLQPQFQNLHNPDEGPGNADYILPEYEGLLAQIPETRSQFLSASPCLCGKTHS